MAAGIVTTILRFWAPTAGSVIAILTAVMLVLHIPRARVELAPLPAAVHVSSQQVRSLGAETRSPLFAPSRSNDPVGAAGQAAQVPPPGLTGIVIGGGRTVALIKTAKGDTIMAHTGDMVDGWTIVTITQGAIVVQRGGAQQTINLVFGTLKTTAPATAGTTAPPPVPLGHTAMASPSFDGLAAVRRRGLPEANIPTGSPLVPPR